MNIYYGQTRFKLTYKINKLSDLKKAMNVLIFLVK